MPAPIHPSRRRSTWLRLFVACLVAACVVPASAIAGAKRYPVSDAFAGSGPIAAGNETAVLKQLWSSAALDKIANDVAGTTDMNVFVEDDPVEWASFIPPDLDSTNVLGFVQLANPALFHKILVGPFGYTAFAAWFATGSPLGNEYAFSVAAMTLIHESFHWRLMSPDESTVNACALKYLPTYLEKDFNVAPTVSQTTTQDVPVTTSKQVPVTTTKVTKYRVKVHGKWVTKTKRTKVTTYVTQTVTSTVSQTVTTTAPNPLFQTVVADAADFYTHQPPPYNAGTCSV